MFTTNVHLKYCSEVSDTLSPFKERSPIYLDHMSLQTPQSAPFLVLQLYILLSNSEKLLLVFQNGLQMNSSYICMYYDVGSYPF